jgi:serine/threonine protein kinase
MQSPPSPPRQGFLEPGTVVAGRHRIDKLLGEGGMGAVYLSTHLELGRREAIKVLRPAIAADTEAIARFKRGTQNADRFQHPNVCTIYDFFPTEDGFWVLRMEYVDGETLQELLDRVGRLPPRRALHLVEQIAAAVQAAHEVGIVHRDLKPSNVMIAAAPDGTDRVKVVDFDISKQVEEGLQPGVTRQDMIIGTPAYMSPERIRNEALDRRSDVYSLGLVAYRMFAGRLPYPTGTRDVMSRAWAQQPPPPWRLCELAPGESFPATVQEVLDRALAHSPAERTPTAAEFAAQLRHAVRKPETRVADLSAIETQIVGPAVPQDRVAPDAGMTEAGTRPDNEPGAAPSPAAEPPPLEADSVRPGPDASKVAAAESAILPGRDSPPGRVTGKIPSRARFKRALKWAAIPVAFVPIMAALSLYLRPPPELVYADLTESLREDQVRGALVDEDQLIVDVETNGVERRYRVDLRGAELHRAVSALRAANVPTRFATGAGSLTVDLVDSRTGDPEVVAPLTIRGVDGDVCSPCPAGSILRIPAGSYDLVLADGEWTLDSVQVRAAVGSYQDELIAGSATVFLPRRAGLQLRLAVSAVGDVESAAAADMAAAAERDDRPAPVQPAEPRPLPRAPTPTAHELAADSWSIADGQLGRSLRIAVRYSLESPQDGSWCVAARYRDEADWVRAVHGTSAVGGIAAAHRTLHREPGRQSGDTRLDMPLDDLELGLDRLHARVRLGVRIAVWPKSCAEVAVGEAPLTEAEAARPVCLIRSAVGISADPVCR